MGAARYVDGRSMPALYAVFESSVTDGTADRILRIMDRQDLSSVTFGPATAAELPAALRLVFGGVEESCRSAQIAAAQQEIKKNSGTSQILLVARRGDALVAAVWLQIQPGRVASLWSVGLGAGEPASAALALISLATAEAAAAGTRFVQTLLETDAGREAEWLRQASFQHITDLLYLVSLPETFPASRPGSDLAFECVGKEGEMGISETQMRRLAEIIRHTYIDTQDCRAVQGLRTVEDVLATYRSVGTFNPAQWFFVVHDQRDIGCLIMADHLLERNCELVYMGIVPESRGLSHGVEIVRFAQWQAGISKITGGNSEQNGEHAVDRLVLAVDVANSPAIRMYATAGFQTWDRRSVFLREIAEKN